ncbi:nucleotide sugar dehydrogenase [Acidimicrobiaceae bacterium]|jgi:UDP-N-acetyl-D-glucosamine dehydrogenase|nr:nucleotide sugar dehydrogenase [Acidimicrobiia bacterium]MDA7850229.1 nucleotide sugar dehydrogenase [Acidimicrobiaceae bacterium]MDA8813271.1 nucleotide sugar dehydrogenase [Candidatus Actinomarina sp.]MDB3866849.1 nucleotide sugar dehydrogenase [Acidimicrobiia bacterium]MDB3983671.1 nucleotide sugar dehydrogenase [Acidimicrobiia bacterium]
MSNFKYDVAVIGLGYVGLPLAIQATSSDLKVYGYDIDENKISNYNLGKSTIEDISDKELEASLEKGLFLSSDPKYLSESETIVISVPTPLTDYQPDLSYVKAAAETIAKNITKNQIIILESTTYPGTTVEVLIPVIEEISNLKAGVDFFVGYSPERIDPGNDTWNFKNTPKVISGINDESLLKIENFYEQIIDTVVRVSGTKEAEMVKLLENTYRHVNIALINELAILCNMLEIDIWEVVNAAKTKPFGFESFRPGPGVGGHCIPVDPNYLSFKTRQIGKPVRFVELAQEINNSMPSYVVSRLLEKMNLLEKPFKNSNILILGVAYKKDIGDTRESPAIGIIENLFERGVNVKYFDPFVDNILVNEKYVEKENSLDNIDKFDLVLVHTAHTDFENFDFTKVSVPIFDATGSDHFKNAERI